MIKLPKQIKIKPLILTGFIFLFSRIANLNPAVPFFLIILCIFFLKTVKNKECNLLNFSFLLLAGFTAGYFTLKSGLSFYFIPIIILPMLSALLFNCVEVPFFLSLGASAALAPLASDPFKALFLFLTSCLSAILLVRGARKRTTIIRAGLTAGFIQLIALLLLEGFWINNAYRYLVIIINGFFCGAIVLAILPVFEYLLQKATNISLLELADTNHSILQKLIAEAPGTYHHSLIVGNLSESACKTVNANALLARIGAYYHDIGKLHNPEYFIENQDIKSNKHDNLTPTMSKLIIMNHVKEGLKLAKKYKLSPSLWDFIAQHHGSSLVYYFYRRALEGKEVNEEVTEEGFRYPGPKPDSKETAIVALADSVEAAARALKDPTPAKIEELVHRIINNKFIDGQLDECDLTLKEIEKITNVFIKILSGIYHSRIGY